MLMTLYSPATTVQRRDRRIIRGLPQCGQTHGGEGSPPLSCRQGPYATRVGAVSVVDQNGELLGLVTDYDIRKALESGRDLMSLKIPEMMNPSPDVVFSDDKAVDALQKMKGRDKPTAIMPVLNRNNKVVGMIHLHDLISAGL